MWRQALFLLAVAGSLGFAPAPFLEKGRNSKASFALHGRWFHSSGTEMRFTGDRLVYYRDGKPTGPGYKIVLDPRPSPGHIELNGVQTWAKAKFTGIYKVEGTTLTICLTTKGQPRPTKFSGAGKYVVERRRP